MSERQKLDLGGFKARERSPDEDVLRRVSEEHGFPSRDPAPSIPESRPANRAFPEFRRPGRPQSDRLIPLNVRLNAETMEEIYKIRDSKPRQTLADVLETLVDFYRHNVPE